MAKSKRRTQRKAERKVRVGGLSMPEYAAAKPVALGPGKKLLSSEEVIKAPRLSAPLATLDDSDQKLLVYERYRLEPDFTLGIVDFGNFKKKEVLGHITEGTPLGQIVVQAELNYVDELLGAITRPPRPRKPKVPAVKPAPIPEKWKWVPSRWRWLVRATVLFCENTTDAVTGDAAQYRKKYVHSVFKQRGFDVVVLEGLKDVRAEFAPRAKSRRVVYISGIGHGSPTTYTGHLNSPILRVGEYDPSEVAGKSIHFLSCQTAKKLGPDTVSKRARSYAGYYENFTFVWNETTRFWDCDSAYDIAMAGGATSAQATRVTINRFNYHIAQVPGTAAATWLTWDRNWLRTPVHGAEYGNGNARISPWLIQPFMDLEEAIQALAA
jgi:hypothetical protein